MRPLDVLVDGRWRVRVPHDGISDVRLVVQPDGRPVAYFARPHPDRRARMRGEDWHERPVVEDTEAPLGTSAIRLSWGPKRRA